MLACRVLCAHSSSRLELLLHLLLLKLLLLLERCQPLAVALAQPPQCSRSFGFAEGRPVGDPPQAAVYRNDQGAQVVQSKLLA